MVTNLQFEKSLVSVFYSNLVINLAKQTLHIKYGFDETSYQISKAWAFYFQTRKFLPTGVYVKNLTFP